MNNQFLGNNHSISLDEAKKMTKKFRDDKDKIVRDEFRGKHLLPDCESFDRIVFDILLQREDCKGVRIYYGMREGSQEVHAIVVGFDAEGKDILPTSGLLMDGTDPEIIENSVPCPPSCPPPSELNT